MSSHSRELDKRAALGRKREKDRGQQISEAREKINLAEAVRQEAKENEKKARREAESYKKLAQAQARYAAATQGRQQLAPFSNGHPSSTSRQKPTPQSVLLPSSTIQFHEEAKKPLTQAQVSSFYNALDETREAVQVEREREEQRNQTVQINRRLLETSISRIRQNTNINRTYEKFISTGNIELVKRIYPTLLQMLQGIGEVDNTFMKFLEAKRDGKTVHITYDRGMGSYIPAATEQEYTIYQDDVTNNFKEINVDLQGQFVNYLLQTNLDNVQHTWTEELEPHLQGYLKNLGRKKEEGFRIIVKKGSSDEPGTEKVVEYPIATTMSGGSRLRRRRSVKKNAKKSRNKKNLNFRNTCRK
jgi:hypothetical protein